MARGTSVFLRILNQLEADVKKITAANGFVTDFSSGSVSLLSEKWLNLNKFPQCLITYNGGMITDFYVSKGAKKRKVIKFIFFLRDSKEKETLRKIADLETDFEYMFYTTNPYLKEDTTNDRLVSKMMIVSDKTFKIQGKPFQAWSVDLEVTFHELYR